MKSAMAVIAILIAACSANEPGETQLAVGTWGGADAGAIVTDTLAHVHIGCTYGDIPGRVQLDVNGAFNVIGSYLLRAYPIAVGPTMPAEFNGSVKGTTLTLTVIVHDTVNDTTVTKGPVKMTYGKEPSMGPCPICRKPGDRATASKGSR
jgi:hypothetical protein